MLPLVVHQNENTSAEYSHLDYSHLEPGHKHSDSQENVMNTQRRAPVRTGRSTPRGGEAAVVARRRGRLQQKGWFVTEISLQSPGFSTAFSLAISFLRTPG